jgi:hypothetical protein
MADKEKMISIYNPFIDAFCAVPISIAQKLVDQVEKIKAAIEKAKAV